MEKLIVYTLLLAAGFMMWAVQLDHELSIRTLFWAKQRVNHAAHAAALQLDEAKLARGIRAIDSDKANEAFRSLLRANMKLDSGDTPLPGSRLRESTTITTFHIVHEHETFPYVYAAPISGYQPTLHRPGVVAAVRIRYPRMFTLFGPLQWDVKGVAQLAY